MGIREIEVEFGGVPHTVQVNEDDKSCLYADRKSRESKPTAKAKSAPRNKAVKPAANKSADPAVTAASDPGASE